MRFPKHEILVSAKEFEVLEKIAYESKMDIWFEVRDVFNPHTGRYQTLIWDRERNWYITPKYGIRILSEGMSNYEDYYLTKSEIKTFEALLKKLKIEMPYFSRHKN